MEALHVAEDEVLLMNYEKLVREGVHQNQHPILEPGIHWVTLIKLVVVAHVYIVVNSSTSCTC